MRPLITASSIGWVYLWHFARPIGNLENSRAQAQHYLGYADDPDGDGAELEIRAAQHLAGRGAKITRAVLAQGIEIVLVAAWRAPLSFEKQLKRRKEAPRYCPICCAARGWRRKHPIVPAVQLVLPLDEVVSLCDTAGDTIDPGEAGAGDFPDPPRLPMDGYEIGVLRGYRAARTAALAGGEDWDDGLL